MNLMEQLNRERELLVVLVTHEPIIAAYARRIVFMRDGLILHDYPVRDRHQALEAVHKIMTEAAEVEVAEARE